jgi:hypothetical protein
MSPKRTATKSSTQKQLDQMLLLKKPAEQIGKQIKVPGAFWEGNMTPEEMALEYQCTIRSYEALHKFPGGGVGQAFELQEMGVNGAGSQRCRNRRVASGRGVSGQCACNRRSGAPSAIRSANEIT